jgi:K+-transporting ATPase ATPase A chain
MFENSLLNITIYLLVLLSLIKPLGIYIARVYEDKLELLQRVIGPIERSIYRACGISQKQEMNWKEYTLAMLIFSLFGIVVSYAIVRFQSFLPLNPQQFSDVSPDLAFNIAVGFATNTDWQSYSGESTLSYSSQMLALTVQNFISAAVGLSILIAFIRGIQRRETTLLGNFWVDTVRGILYILLPLAILLAIALVSEGVIQNFNHYQQAELIQPIQYQYPEQLPILKNVSLNTNVITHQLIPMGPVASQVAIKQLGSNGGGFFNTNSSHPFENPSPLSNFLEMVAILLIPMALCYTFGTMVKDTKQGLAIFLAMFFILLPLMLATVWIENQTNPTLPQLTDLNNQNNDNISIKSQGNMEGKEQRFGLLNSGIWAAATTASSNGANNSTISSFLPLGGLISLWLIDLGEVVFGGVGSGFYRMLIFVIIAVFLSGLMVGRTPEYLGKKIESFEIKMASLAILIMPLMVLSFTSIALMKQSEIGSFNSSSPHGFTEVLYAFSSLVNNNGSAFSGLNTNTVFYNTLGGLAMLVGRFWIAIPVLAIAGSLARKKIIPTSSGTLPTDTPLFISVVVAVVLMMGALSFFPAFSLGPIVEHLMLYE